MKFISIAVMALLSSTDAIRVGDMEVDEQIGAEVAAQISAEGGAE